MTIYDVVFLGCWLAAALGFAVLIPLEFSLRQSHKAMLPRLGFPVRRIESDAPFQSLLALAMDKPDLFPVRVNNERFIVSTQNVRCIVERCATGDRSVLTFRYPFGLVLFVTAIPVGAIVRSFENVIADPSTIFGFLFSCCFMGFLAFAFLSLFWQMAVDESDTISGSLDVLPQRNRVTIASTGEREPSD